MSNLTVTKSQFVARSGVESFIAKKDGIRIMLSLFRYGDRDMPVGVKITSNQARRLADWLSDAADKADAVKGERP